ncbi:hypothetical protein LTR97_010185 [Elasticomyces elasticus]|uniref:HypA-like protein n=1 Tax=Elasticomyces elasticus TaxID=574655 RepID=A0AAN7W0L6_9PEZI|nr:hypothetical protein LTR97_010185 [Elasticomyces elasticus]
MATASKIQLHATQQPEYYRHGIEQAATEKASALLQKNHDQHHIFFNRDGFHDHIAHHLLTIWALRANSNELQHAYDINAGYQRTLGKLAATDMHDAEKFKSYLGKEQYYHDFMVFFQDEIEKTSMPEVVNKYLLAGDERADDLLCRLFAGFLLDNGLFTPQPDAVYLPHMHIVLYRTPPSIQHFLHSLIHVGFAVEFEQPAIVAEALAQAAVHGPYMSKFFLPTEEAAKERSNEPPKSIVQILDEVHADAELREAPRWSDGNKLRDGIIGRAGARMASLASQFHVKTDELERKTAEMANAAAYFTAGAQKDGYARKYDFYYMHCVNCSIFLSTLLKLDWITDANKVRLLNWKVWNDLAMYASRKSPDIRMDLVRQYNPKESSGWDGIFDRVTGVEDDGHASKLVRALAHGQQICGPYEDREEFRVKHDDWLLMGHMAIDSVEAGEPHWVRSAGFDEAWDSPALRAQL